MSQETPIDDDSQPFNPWGSGAYVTTPMRQGFTYRPPINDLGMWIHWNGMHPYAPDYVPPARWL